MMKPKSPSHRILLAVALALWPGVTSCADDASTNVLSRTTRTPASPAPALDLVARLDALPPLTIPHYWTISNVALYPDRRETVMAICRVTRGVAFGHTSPGGAKLAMDAQRETGCQVAMFMGIRVRFDSLDGVLRHRKTLRARAAEGARPGVVLFHFEQREGWAPATESLTHVYAAMIRESFPDAQIGFYHWPGWHMSWSGAGPASVYTGFTPPADIAVCNLYGQDAAHNSYVRRMNTRAGNGRPLLPFLSFGFTYRSTVERDGRGGWHSDRSARRTPAASWNIARHLAVHAIREPGIAGVWLWEFLMERGGDAAKLADFEAYVRGWHNLPLTSQQQER